MSYPKSKRNRKDKTVKCIARLTAYIGMMRQDLEQFIEIQKEIFENGD